MDNNYYKGFTQLSKTNFGENYMKTMKKNDEIVFGYHNINGGIVNEVLVEWKTIEGKDIANISLYNDSFTVFSDFSDLFQELAKLNTKTIKPNEMVEILKNHGFKDCSLEV